MKMWSAGDNVEVKEGPVRFVVVVHAANRETQMAQDAMAPTAAMAITAVWSKKVQPNHLRSNIQLNLKNLVWS